MDRLRSSAGFPKLTATAAPVDLLESFLVDLVSTHTDGSVHWQRIEAVTKCMARVHVIIAEGDVCTWTKSQRTEVRGLASKVVILYNALSQEDALAQTKAWTYARQFYFCICARSGLRMSTIHRSFCT